MPNHVLTSIRAARPVIHALLNERGVDFGRVIPPPTTPAYTANSCSHAGDCPPDCWYRWNRENWGTKWNGYETELRNGDTELRFQTAWNHPWRVIEALSRKFPDEWLNVRYADEDMGANLGEYGMAAGIVVTEVVIDPAEAVKCAEALWEYEYDESDEPSEDSP